MPSLLSLLEFFIDWYIVLVYILTDWSVISDWRGQFCPRYQNAQGKLPLSWGSRQSGSEGGVLDCAFSGSQVWIYFYAE